MNDNTLRITAAAVLCCLIVGGSAGVYAAARANDGGSSLFTDVEVSPAPVQEAPQQAGRRGYKREQRLYNSRSRRRY